MEIYPLRLLASLLIIDVTFAKWTSSGSSQTFTFVFSKISDGFSMLWLEKQTCNLNITLFQCTYYPNLNCSGEDGYNDNKSNYNATIVSNTSHYISTLTIKSVTPLQHETTWFCRASIKNGSVESQYDLKVFTTAESPTCDKVTLHNEMSIQINCWTKKVFPGLICVFNSKTNDSSVHELEKGSITYSNKENEESDNYKFNCTYKVSAATLGPGSHIFNVVMYPNITDKITEEIKARTEYTTPFEIYYPKAVLKDDCHVNGYIKENMNGTCTCYSNNTSRLSTNVIWSNNYSVAIFPNATLQFQAKREQRFICTILNSLNWSDSIIFQPKVSYPPDKIFININDKNLNICKEKNVAISGMCYVGESNPESSVYLNINNSLTELNVQNKSTEFIFNKTMVSPGIYNIYCIANSPEYSNITSDGTSLVTIKGPPKIPRIFINNKAETNPSPNNLLEVTKGDTITCDSKGGYPLTKNLSLSCGHEEISVMNQDQVNMTLNISIKTNVTCECIVWHESTCQQNKTIVELKFVDLEIIPGADQDFTKTYIGVGVIAGCVVLIIVVLFIITNLRPDLFKKKSSEMTEKLVNNGDLYFVKKGIENSSIDTSFYPAYTNVVTTMSSAMEAPKNFKKKA